MTSPRCKWSRQDIRDARRVSLPDVLSRHGFALSETGGGNFRLSDHPGLIVKDCYWRWPERGSQGNAIDFCTQVLGLSFHDAMRALTP